MRTLSFILSVEQFDMLPEINALAEKYKVTLSKDGKIREFYTIAFTNKEDSKRFEKELDELIPNLYKITK